MGTTASAPAPAPAAARSSSRNLNASTASAGAGQAAPRVAPHKAASTRQLLVTEATLSAGPSSSPASVAEPAHTVQSPALSAVTRESPAEKSRASPAFDFARNSLREASRLQSPRAAGGLAHPELLPAGTERELEPVHVRPHTHLPSGILASVVRQQEELTASLRETLRRQDAEAALEALAVRPEVAEMPEVREAVMEELLLAPAPVGQDGRLRASDEERLLSAIDRSLGLGEDGEGLWPEGGEGERTWDEIEVSGAAAVSVHLDLDTSTLGPPSVPRPTRKGGRRKGKGRREGGPDAAAASGT